MIVKLCGGVYNKLLNLADLYAGCSGGGLVGMIRILVL